MAESTCPKCDSHTFETKKRESSGLLFVQCAECGCVITAMDTSHMDKRFNLIHEKLERHDGLLADILSQVLRLIAKP